MSKATEHMKHTAILFQHLNNIRQVYKIDEDEPVDDFGKGIISKLGLFKILKKIRKEEEHLKEEGNISKD